VEKFQELVGRLHDLLLPGNTKYAVMQSLEKFGGKTRNYQFVEHGWRHGRSELKKIIIKN
jgi:hypothetical protein